MHKIGFVTCSDLSRFFPSRKNPLLTHDDQIAADFLERRGFRVEPVVWGTDPFWVAHQKFDLLIIRSPWDYMDSVANQRKFLSWCEQLSSGKIPIANSFDVMRWNLDKHYLMDLARHGIPTPPTLFLEPEDSLDLVYEAQKKWGEIVIKPCISAAATDTFLIQSALELDKFVCGNRAHEVPFNDLRCDRAFIIQPFLKDVQTEGEWSIIFLDEEYSHAVLKLPREGGWLVQDEQGGSVFSFEPPKEIRDLAQEAFMRLLQFIKQWCVDPLLYARVDVVPKRLIGELELIEPELFFLNRETQSRNDYALERLYRGICRRLLFMS